MPGPEGFGYSGAENYRAKGTPFLPNEKAVDASTLPKSPPKASRSISERLSVGRTYYLPNGDEVTVAARPPLPPRARRPISRTAYFEGGHAALGKKNKKRVQEVSIIPTQHSRGHTILSEYDGEAAAFHVLKGGGEHDAKVIEYHGDNVHEKASKAGKSEITHQEEILDIAEALMDKGKLNDEGVDSALQRGHMERGEQARSYFMADVYIRQRDGKLHKKEKVFAPEGVIFYPENGKVPSGTTIH